MARRGYLQFVFSCMVPAIAGELLVVMFVLTSPNVKITKWTYIAWLSIALAVFVISSVAYYFRRR